MKYKEHKGAVNSLTCSSLEGHSQELEENINNFQKNILTNQKIIFINLILFKINIRIKGILLS